jgi:hypothetical protein
MRVRQLPRPDDRESIEKYNRAARVIAAWLRESDFQDAEGEPASLPIAGPGVTFSELVKRFSGDVPVRAILDELIRVGAVERLEDGRICLLTRAYIPESSDADKLHILGTDAGHLISTIGHNLEKLDQWLAQRDRDVNPTVEGTGRNRAGVGVYYFEEPYSDEEN